MRIVSLRRDGKISYGLPEGDEIADLPGPDLQGIGAARTPPPFLRPGDTVVISIDGVTELTDPVVGEDS